MMRLWPRLVVLVVFITAIAAVVDAREPYMGPVSTLEPVSAPACAPALITGQRGSTQRFILCIGGSPEFSESVTMLDVESWSWYTGAAPPTYATEGRKGAFLHQVSSDLMLRVGGETAHNHFKTISVDVLNTTALEWSSIQNAVVAGPVMPIDASESCYAWSERLNAVIMLAGKPTGFGLFAQLFKITFNTEEKTAATENIPPNSSAPFLVSRYRAGCVVVGDYFYVFGGANLTHHAMSSAWRFDLRAEARVWQQLPDMPAGAIYAPAVRELPGGLILVAGGCFASGHGLPAASATYVFDPTRFEWTAAPPVTPGIELGCFMRWAGDWLIGGERDADVIAGQSTTRRFDTTSRRFVAPPEYPAVPSTVGHIVFVTRHDDLVVTHGGLFPNGTVSSTITLLNMTSNAIVGTYESGLACHGHAVSYPFVFGGVCNGALSSTLYMFVHDSPTDTPRFEMKGTTTKTFPVMLAVHIVNFNSCVFLRIRADKWNDLETLRWSFGDGFSDVAVIGGVSEGQPFQGSCAALLNGRLWMFFGGFDASTSLYVSNTLVLDLSQEPLANVGHFGSQDPPSGRAWHACATDSAGLLFFVHGGVGSTGTLHDTHVFNVQDNTWSRLSGGFAQFEGRSLSSMVFVHDRLVIVGGELRDGTPAPFAIVHTGLRNVIIKRIRGDDILCQYLARTSCSSMEIGARFCQVRGLNPVIEEVRSRVIIEGTVTIRTPIESSCAFNLYGLPSSSWELPPFDGTIDCMHLDAGTSCFKFEAGVVAEAAATMTIARIYFKQGAVDAVLDVYGLQFTLSGLVFGHRQNGNALRALRSNVAVHDSKFKGGTGRAISVESSNVYITSSTFADSMGGAISVLSSQLGLDECSFTGNAADVGGAVWVRRSTIGNGFSYNVFENNAALNGGAVYLDDTDVILFSNTFRSNHGVDGSAVFLDGTSQLHVVAGAMADNSAQQGTIFVSENSNATLVSGSYARNRARIAGGVCFTRVASVHPSSVQCVVQNSASTVNNTADTYGDWIASQALSLRLLSNRSSFVNVTGGSEPVPRVALELVDLFEHRVATSVVNSFVTAVVNQSTDSDSALFGELTVRVEAGVAVFDRLIVAAPPQSSVFLQFMLNSAPIGPDGEQVQLSSALHVYLKACGFGEYVNARGACTPCSPGSFSVTPQTACELCKPGTFQDKPAQSHCKNCLPGEFENSHGASVCSRCSPGYFYNGDVCWRCISGRTVCPDGRVVLAEAGFFVAPSASAEDGQMRVTPCEACVDGHECEQNTTAQIISCCKPNRPSASQNALCAHCDEGFSEWNGECVPSCDWNGGLLFAFAVGGCVYAWVLHRLAQSTTAVMAILFYFLQTSYLMLTSANYVGAVLQVAAFDVRLSRHSTCLGPVSAMDEFWLSLLTPLFLLAFVGCGLLVQYCYFVYRHNVRRENFVLPPSIAPYVRTSISLFLASFSAIANTIVRFFNCEEVEDGVFLVVSDPRIQCFEAQWNKAAFPLVLIGVFVLIVIPVGLWWAIFRHKQRGTLRSSAVRSRLGNLFEVFEIERPFVWAWAFVVLARRTLVVIVITAIRDTQTMFAALTAVNIAILVHHIFARPFSVPLANHMETGLLLLLALLANFLSTVKPPLTTGQTAAIATAIYVPSLCVVATRAVPTVRRWLQRRALMVPSPLSSSDAAQIELADTDSMSYKLIDDDD